MAVYPTMAAYVDFGLGGGGGGSATDINQLITLGIGTPSDITHLILMGLSPSSSGGASWSDVSADLVADLGVRVKYGIEGNLPTNCSPSTGECQLSLRNDARNSASTLGYYSTAHASKRAGWAFGLPIKLEFTYNGTTYTKFRGKVRVIDPDPGKYRNRRTHVTSYDVVRELAETDAREVTTQLAQGEDDLIGLTLDAIPPGARPIARDIDAGVDTIPIAFDDIGGAVKAYTLLDDLVVSSLGIWFVKGDGTFCYRSRHSIAIEASVFAFNDTMQGLSVPSIADKAYKRVRVTNHPKTVSATATEELYTMPAGTSLEIQAGTTIRPFTDYSDPNDRQTDVGGVNVVTTLVGGTHYTANSAADGSGSDLTGSITATIYPFSSTAKWALTNTSGVTAFITQLKIIGKAVRDLGPQTFEAPLGGELSIDIPYRQEIFTTLEIDLPYQDDPYVAQSSADYMYAQYSDLTDQIDAIEFNANTSHDLMVQALAREPGDCITVAETVTGISTTAMIQSVELNVQIGRIVTCRWGLRPANTTQFWQWGVVGVSEWGVSTRYAF